MSQSFRGDEVSKTHLKSLNLGNLETIGDDTRVQSFRNVSVCLLEKLTNQHHHGGGSVTANIVLSGRGSSNHNGGRVLYLHLSEENVSILGQLDLGSSVSLGVAVGYFDRSLYLSRTVNKPETVSFTSLCDNYDNTHILMVPRGPRLDFKTSCRPSPALMLTFRASPLLCDKRVSKLQGKATFGCGGVYSYWYRRTRDSALGLRSCAADMIVNLSAQRLYRDQIGRGLKKRCWCRRFRDFVIAQACTSWSQAIADGLGWDIFSAPPRGGKRCKVRTEGLGEQPIRGDFSQRWYEAIPIS